MKRKPMIGYSLIIPITGTTVIGPFYVSIVCMYTEREVQTLRDKSRMIRLI